MEKTGKNNQLRLLSSIFTILSLFVFVFNANSQCNYQLKLQDSYGDGWDSGRIEVKNGNVTTTYKFSNGLDTTINIAATSGDSLILRYTALSTYNSEVSFVLFDANFLTVYSSGTSPSLGLAYADTAKCPSCNPPTNILLSNISSTTASINWTEAQSATQWVVEYGQAGFALGTGTRTITNSKPFNLSNLTFPSSYDFWVSSICSPGDTSIFSGPFTFSTPCLAINNFPYFEGFENSVPPACWSENIVSGTTSWNRATSNSSNVTSAYSGSYFAHFISLNSSGHSADLISPNFDLSSLNTPILEFWHTQEDWGGDQDTLGVYYRTSITSPWVYLTSFSNSISSWTNHSIVLPNPSSEYSIMFKAYTDWGYGVTLDDFEIKESPTCPKPSTLSSSSITASSATLSWIEIGTATQWEVEYGSSSYTPGTGTLVNVNTDTFTTITGLSASTNYDFYVRAICGANDTSAWSFAASFLTLCGPITASYSQNFDGTSDPNIDQCWSVINNTNSPFARIQTEDSSFDPQRSSPNSIEFYNSGATTGNLLLISPQFLDLDNTKQIRFWLQNEGNSSYQSDLIVGTMSDPSQDSTFTAFTTISNSSFDFSNWVEFVIPFNGLINGDKFIAFKHGLNTSFDYIFLDDFTYESIPNCPMPNLLSSKVTPNHVELNWIENGTSTQWEVEYGPSGFTQGSGNRFVTSKNPDSLFTLNSNTTYDFYVRSICGIRDTSSWSIKSSFITACTSIQSPYSQNFDGTSDPNIDPCWSVLNATNSSNAWVRTENSSFDPQRSSPNSIEFYNSSASLGNLLLVSPHFSDLDSTKQISFWLQNEGSNSFISDLIVGTMSNPNQDSTFEAFVTIPNGSFSSSSWTEFIIPFSGLKNGDKYIAFKHSLNSSYDYIFMDDFNYNDKPSCPKPSLLNNNVLSPTSAEVSWIEPGSAAQWQIEYGNIGFSLGSGSRIISNSNPDTINGLTPITNYSYYVRSICAAGDTSSWSLLNSFSTPCLATNAPWTEDFYSNSLPNCWFQGGDTPWEFAGFNAYGAGNVTDHTANGGSFIGIDGSDNSSGDISTLTSPLINTATLTNPRLRFYIFSNNTNNSTLNKTIVEFFDGSRWHNVDSIQANLGSNWSERIISLGGFNITGPVKIRFEVSGSITGSTFYNDILLDDISVEETPVCTPPNSLSNNVLGTTSASASWIEVGSSSQWEIEYGVSGFTKGTGIKAIVNSNPDTLNNLSPATSYDWYLRSICGPNDSSVWVGPVSFTTDCNPFLAPYNENFDAALTVAELNNSGINCWNAIGPGANDIKVVNATDHGVNIPTLPYAIEFSNGSWTLGDTAILVSPNFSDLGSGNNRIRFQIAFESTNPSNASLYVGVLSNPNNPSSLNIMDTIDVSNVGGSTSFGQVIINFTDTSLIGNSQHIGIAYGSGTFEAYLDSFIYEAIPTQAPIPFYPISIINSEDSISGIADSLNVNCWTSGTVIGVDLDGNNGISFYISDLSSGSQEGINVFNFNDVSGYVVNEGDSIRVRGDIIQFNGLTEINPDSIEIISTNATLPTPIPVTSLNESTEAKWLSLNDDFVLLDPSGSFSYNMDATNGTDTITIRVDADTDVSDSLRISTKALVAGDTICGMLGVGAQFDNSNPYSSGYQIFPMSYSDVTICRNTVGIEDKKQALNTIDIYPNPTEGQFTIRTSGLAGSNALVRVRDISGKIILNENIAQSNQASTRTYDLNGQAKGIYFISIIDGEQARVFKLIVQ